MSRPRRTQESGFALLLVFVMAAGIAIMLYQQLPRTAFESMRAKEELLIERGEQYTRAVQLFAVKMKRLPQNMDELEKQGNTRFLRRRYKDPFTGKDDWRLIHQDALGQLTDSLIKKKTEEKKNQNTFITEYAGIGQNDTGLGQNGINVALRKRPSEGGTGSDNAPLPLPSFQTPTPNGTVPNPLVDPNQQQSAQNGQNPANPQAFNAGAQPGINPATGQPYPPTAALQGQSPFPGQTTGAINPATGQPYPPGQQPAQVQGYPVAQGYPQPAAAQTGYPQPQGYPQQGYPSTQQQGLPQQGYPSPQQGGFGQPGTSSSPSTYPTAAAGQAGRPGATPTAAIDMINRALTQPSPNNPNAQTANVAAGLGPGLVGVASKFVGPSIKVYNEQQEYKKWEFVYDSKKDKRNQAALAQAGVPMGQQQNVGGQPNGAQPFGATAAPGIGNTGTSSFGSTGVNNSPGFGSATVNQPQTNTNRVGSSGGGYPQPAGIPSPYGTNTGQGTPSGQPGTNQFPNGQQQYPPAAPPSPYPHPAGIPQQGVPQQGTPQQTTPQQQSSPNPANPQTPQGQPNP